jgi:hypothetical protein
MPSTDISTLSKLIGDCQTDSCPLYSKFLEMPNAQGQYRVDHFKWARRYSPRQFTIGETCYGAKLALIMESPPPEFTEYFYGDDGGLEKANGLFACIVDALVRADGKPKVFDTIDLEDAKKLARQKTFWLQWIADLGLVILDAAKCRVKLNRKEASDSEKRQSFRSCAHILQLQLKVLNPFRLAIGLIRVYDSDSVHRSLDILSMRGRLFDERIASPFHGNRHQFVNAVNQIWLKTKVEEAAARGRLGRG